MTRDQLLHACFGRSDFPPPDDRLELVWGEDHVVSHVALYRREVRVAGRPIAVAGIAQVCTDPVIRGDGAATLLLNAMHIRERAEGIQYAALFSDQLDFYAHVGYEPTTLPFFLVAPLVEVPWPEGPIVTRGQW